MAKEKKNTSLNKDNKNASLNKDIGARAPRKRQINLIKKEVQTVDVGKRIVAIAAAFAILVAAGGYAFMRWQTVSGLRRQANQLEGELESMKLVSATYDEINAEYIRYSTAYETAAESRMQDSRILIDKARELIEPYGYITNITVDGNTLEVKVASKDVSLVTDSLNNDPDKLVRMVIPMQEQKDKNAEEGTAASVGGQAAEQPAEGEENPETAPVASDSTVVENKAYVESTATFKLIFADKEG